MTDYPFPREIVSAIPPTHYKVPGSFKLAADRVWATAAATLRARIVGNSHHFDDHNTATAADWFVARQLQLTADHLPDPQAHEFRIAAARYAGAAGHLFSTGTNDSVQFVFWPPAPRWFTPSIEPPGDQSLIQAGRTIGSQFRSDGRYLPSYHDPDQLAITAMASVHAVLYAAQRTGNAALAVQAHEHCLTTRRELIRGDGSVASAATFDPRHGCFREQGYASGQRDGSLALSQAFAMHGFGAAYRLTHDRRLLLTAAAVADYYLERTGDLLIPPTDWDGQSPCQSDSAAAAAAASGFWQLAGLIEDQVRAEVYADYAVAILERLADPDFMATPSGDRWGILSTCRLWSDYCYLNTLDEVGRVDSMRVEGVLR